MRTLLLLPFAALAFAAQASAQQAGDIGARTRSPAAMLGDIRLAPGQDDLAEALAAAAAFPLGSRENPVRVGGPAGEQAYLARLRCADGSAPAIGPRSDAGVGGLGTVVHQFPVRCASGAAVTVVMDMYHEEHREDRAPPGLQILPG
jgi:hypothetical protein